MIKKISFLILIFDPRKARYGASNMSPYQHFLLALPQGGNSKSLRIMGDVRQKFYFHINLQNEVKKEKCPNRIAYFHIIYVIGDFCEKIVSKKFPLFHTGKLGTFAVFTNFDVFFPNNLSF